MLKTLLEALKIVHVAPDDGATTTYALAAGVTTKTSVAVDALGYGRVCFLWTFGANLDTAVFVGKIQGSVDGTNNWTDITGATQTFTDASAATASKVMALECDVLPGYRYYRVSSARTIANSVIASLHAILGRVQGQTPVTQLTTAGQFVAAPVNVIGA